MAKVIPVKRHWSLLTKKKSSFGIIHDARYKSAPKNIKMVVPEVALWCRESVSVLGIQRETMMWYSQG